MRVLIYCPNVETGREIAQLIPFMKGKGDIVDMYRTLEKTCRAYSRGKYGFVVLPDTPQTSGWLHCIRSQGQRVVILNGNVGNTFSKVFK